MLLFLPPQLLLLLLRSPPLLLLLVLMPPPLLLMFHLVLFHGGPSAKPSGLDSWFRRCHSADSSHRALSADRGGGGGHLRAGLRQSHWRTRCRTEDERRCRCDADGAAGRPRKTRRPLCSGDSPDQLGGRYGHGGATPSAARRMTLSAPWRLRAKSSSSCRVRPPQSVPTTSRRSPRGSKPRSGADCSGVKAPCAPMLFAALRR